jgi:hypothetical protein
MSVQPVTSIEIESIVSQTPYRNRAMPSIQRMYPLLLFEKTRRVGVVVFSSVVRKMYGRVVAVVVDE